MGKTRSRPRADSEQRRFIDDIRQIGPGKTWRPTRDLFQIDGVVKVYFLRVDFENINPPLQVGFVHQHLSVEATGPEERGIEDLGPVRRGKDDDAGTGVEAVHLDEQLVKRLLALIVPADRDAAALADGIEFVNEDDAWGLFAGLLEHVADPGRADADEHLHEFGPADFEKGDLGLASDRLSEKGLSRSGGPTRRTPLGIFPPTASYFFGLLEEIHDLHQSALASSTPATSLNVTPVSPSATSFALFVPNDITPWPVLPICLLK